MTAEFVNCDFWGNEFIRRAVNFGANAFKLNVIAKHFNAEDGLVTHN